MSDGGIVIFKSPPVSLRSTTSPCIFKGRHTKGGSTMKDKEKKVNEEVQTEEEGKELTDEELASVTAGLGPPLSEE